MLSSARGFQFVKQNLIAEQQLIVYALNQVAKLIKQSLTDSFSKIFNIDINIWLPKTYTYKSSNYSPVYKESLRESKEKVHEQLIRGSISGKKRRQGLNNGEGIPILP